MSLLKSAVLAAARTIAGEPQQAAAPASPPPPPPPAAAPPPANEPIEAPLIDAKGDIAQFMAEYAELRDEVKAGEARMEKIRAHLLTQLQAQGGGGGFTSAHGDFIYIPPSSREEAARPAKTVTIKASLRWASPKPVAASEPLTPRAA